MNKTFKTLFTLFLGILFFILTFTANSTANAKVVEVCEQDTPNGVAFIKFFSNSEQYDNREHSFTELERRVWGSILECTLVRKSNNEQLYLKILKKSKRWTLYGTGEDRGFYFTHSIKNKSFQKLWKRYAVINPTTYIAKERKKLTQTQQVAKHKDKGLDLLKDQVEVTVWVKHVDKDFDTQRPYLGDADKVIYNLDKGIYTLNPKDPKEEAILIAKEKCWKDNPSNKKGCLIDKINIDSPKTNKTSSYDTPTVTTYLWKEELAKYKDKKQTTQTQQVAKKKPKKKEQTQTQQVAKIDKTKKGLRLFKKEEEKKITIDEVVALGTYQEFESYPEGMLKEFGNCKKQFCRGRIAGKKVYEIFVRRGPLWNERYPGDMIHGMAWFEILYLEKLRKTQKQIERYTKNGPDGYPNDFKKQKDVNALHALSKTNKGRIKMREALGLSAKDDLATVLRSHWLLGDLLNNDKYKVKRVSLKSDLKTRKKLLEKYQASLKQYKEKLEKEN